MGIPDIDIAMIGPSGAGKTSLLASMYSQFTDRIPGAERTNLTLEPDDETRTWLGLRKAELVRISKEILVTERGIPGGAEDRTLNLKLLRKDKKKFQGHLSLRFTDYPGGWLFPPEGARPGPGPGQSELKDRIARSNTMLLAVDTPALMFRDGEYHEELNRPQEVADLVSKWCRETEHRRAQLILVPIKSEKWVGDDEALENLYAEVRDGYPQLTSALTGDTRPHSCRIAPVQTVGSLVHDHYEVDEEGFAISRFRARDARPRYSPKWTVEPLRLILRAAIEQRLEHRTTWERIGRIFGEHKDLFHAVDDLQHADLGPSTRLL